jgi:hypothetical protein
MLNLYPHAVLEIYPMVHNLGRFNLNGVKLGLSQNGVDHNEQAAKKSCVSVSPDDRINSLNTPWRELLGLPSY